jgi:hypothetical protein
MAIWYMLCSFGTFFPVWVSCSKKNLATLLPTSVNNGRTLAIHRNLSTRGRMLKKGANFFQLVSNLICVVKGGFVEPCKYVPL